MSSIPAPQPNSPAVAQIGSALAACGRGMLITNNEARIEYVNDRVVELTGYRSNELLGENPKLLQSGNTSRDTYLAMWNSVSAGKSWRGVLQNRTKSGRLYVEDISITPLTDSRGSITHFMALIEEQPPSIGARSTQTRAAIDSVRLVAKGVSHELNNSLMGIIGSCSIAERDLESTSPVMQRLKTIRSSVNRLTKFTKTLAVSGGIALSKPAEFDLAEAAISTIDDLEAQGRGASITCHIPLDPLRTLGDEALIRSALTRMLDNALEAGEPNSPIEVVVGRTEWEGVCEGKGRAAYDFGLPEGDVAYIEVTDHGQGMDNLLLQKVGQLFFSTRSAHLGLGLSYILGVAKSHEGALELASAPGGGTSVRLLLPRATTIRRAPLPRR
ncbi:MAG: ATP-binding protein [Bdellovibrionota bacterium]